MTKQSPLTDAQIQAIRELLARRPAEPSANTLAEFWQLGAGYIRRLLDEIETLRAASRQGAIVTDESMLATAGKFCRGEGCPRADLCRRYMDAAKVESPTYFEKSPFQADGQCGEFASNGWLRSHALHCGGAHPPPACAWQCAIELHRWEKRGDEWIWIAGAEH